MNKDTALAAFTALSQDTRLDAFRLLLETGEAGLAAGQISDALGVRQNTMSAHLAQLHQAGLIHSKREGRVIRYFADLDGIRGLLGFLMQDCCGGRPDQCQPFISEIASTSRKDPSMTDDVKNVLFLCTGNSARSLIAEAIVAREGLGRFRGFSAGSSPEGAPNPHAISLLASLNHDTSVLRSKSWDEFATPDAPKMDFVFTVCDRAAAEPCPVWPGQPMSAHWGVPDPAAVTGSDAEIGLAFADTYRMLRNRISIFVNLPLDTLDTLSLQRNLDEIGQTDDQEDTQPA